MDASGHAQFTGGSSQRNIMTVVAK
jgi:hypothetical protein